MANIITRETVGLGATVKGSPLNNNEVDTNFINLNADLSTSDYVVDNIAALKAVDSTIHTSVSTRGYYDVVGVGAGTYWYDSTDTTSVDNGGTVIVATDGARWKLIHNDVIDVAQFGACTNVDDIIYITAAITWALNSRGQAINGTHSRITLTMMQKCFVSHGITYGTLTNVDFYWPGGLEAVSWTGLSTDTILHIKNHHSTITLGIVECNGLCNGVTFQSYDHTINEGVIQHPTEWAGYQPAAQGGACTYNNVRFTQWQSNDAEFENKANFTAKGFWLAGADSCFNNCNFSWSRYPLYIDTTAVANSFNQCHWFQGSTTGSSVPYNNAINVYNLSAHDNFLRDCHYDIGYVVTYDVGLNVDGGFFPGSDFAGSSFPEPLIRCYAKTANKNAYKIAVTNIKASVGFLSGGDFGGSFLGDYTVSNAITSRGVDGRLFNVFAQQINIQADSGVYNTISNYKPASPWVETYNIGPTAVHKWFYTDTEVQLKTEGAFRITTTSGAPVNKIVFGDGTVGVGELNNNVLSMSSGTVGNCWDFIANGNLLPVADITYDIGSASSTRKVRRVVAQNILIVPTTVEAISSNGVLAFEWVDDSHFKIKQRGYDGVTRSVTLTTS